MNLMTARIVTIATVAIAFVFNPQGALFDLAIIGSVVVAIDTAKPVKRWLEKRRGGKRGSGLRLLKAT